MHDECLGFYVDIGDIMFDLTACKEVVKYDVA